MNDSFEEEVLHLYSFSRSRLLSSGLIGSELPVLQLRLARARFLYLVFAQKTDFAFSLSPSRKSDFARECCKWLTRLDGLGGVW